MRRVLRVLGRLLRYVAGGLAVLFVLAFVALHTNWTTERLRRLATAQADRYLSGRLAIGHLGGSLLHDVVLDNVVLTEAGETVLQARRITVTYDLLTILRQGAVIRQIVVDDLTLHLVERDTGWNVAQLARPRPATPGGAPPRFALNEVRVTGGVVTVAAAGRGVRRIRDVAIDARVAQTAGAVIVTVNRLSALDEASGFQVEELSGSFDGALQHVDATVRAVAGDTRVSGRVSGQPTAQGRQFSGDMDLTRLDLSRILDDPGWSTDITGHATVRADLPAAETSPAIAFTFAGPQASAFGYEGRALDVHGTFADGRLRIGGAGRGYGASATIDATWTPAATADTPGFEASGTFQHADLSKLPPRLSAPPFHTDASGRFTVARSAPDWRAVVTLDPSTVGEAAIAAGTTGRVDVRAGELRYEASGRVDRLDLRAISGPLDVPLLAQDRFHSRVNAEFHVNGATTTASGRTLAGTAHLRDTTLADTHVDDMDVAIDLAGRRLAIDAHGDFTGLTAVTAGLPSTRPESPNFNFNLNGRVDAHLDWPDYDAPFDPAVIGAAGQVQLSSSTIADVAVSSARLDGSLESGVVTVRELAAEAAGMRASAQGTAAIGPAGESALTVKVAAGDLGTFGTLIGQPLAGTAELAATITGPADRPHFAGTLLGRGVKYGDTATARELETTFDATLPDRRIDRVVAHATTTATELHAADVDWTRATLSADVEGRNATADAHLEALRGTIDVGGAMDLTPEARAITLHRLDLSSGSMAWTMPPDTAGQVHLDSDRIRVDHLVLARDAQRLTVDGALLRESGRATGPDPHLGVRAEQVQLADLNLLFGGQRPVTGLLSGSATVAGSLMDPTVAATVAVGAGTVEQAPFDAVRATVQYADHLATVDATLEEGTVGRLTMVGTVPVGGGSAGAPAREIDLRITSTPVPLGLMRAFTTELADVTGTGTVDLRIAGPTSAPLVDGTVTLTNGAFRLAATGVRYRDLNAGLRFDHSHLQISSFSLNDTDGHSLQIAGGVDIAAGEAAPAVDLTITARGLHVLDNSLGSLQMRADLRATGALTAPRVTGELRVEQGQIEVGAVLERATTRVYDAAPEGGPAAPRRAAGTGAAMPTAPPPAAAAGAAAPAIPPPAPASGLFSGADLAIKVILPDNLVLRGRDLRVSGSSMGLGDINVIAGGSLDLRRPPGAGLTVLGAMQIVRGSYSFQGRRFEVQRSSSVRFRGVEPIDPELNVTANRDVSGVVASVNVQGSASAPTITLSSKPPLDDSDILSLIVFGQPVNELGLAQQTSLSQRAAAMAASAIATPIADSVARALNLDLFEIQPTGSGSGAPVVSLGSQIGSRLYVGVKQDVGRTENRVVSLEFRIAEFLRLVTSVAQGALQQQALGRAETSGIDLLFVFRY